MAVPFGFSVGDFVAAIELTIRIGKALKDSDGATAECLLVLQDLQLLRQVLEILRDLQPVGLCVSYVNAIKGTALTCLSPLKEFEGKLNKSYGSALGKSSSANIVKRAGKKTQWALLAADEVSKFRAIISAKVVSISMLLGACNSEALSRVHIKTQETQRLLLDQAKEHERHLDQNFSDLSVNATQNRDDLLAKVTQSRQQLKSELSALEQRQTSQHENIIRELNEQQEATRSLDARLTKTFQDTRSHYSRLVSICCGVSLANHHMLKTSRHESQEIKTELRLITATQQETQSETSSNFQHLVFQMKALQSIGENILNLLIPFSQTVLDYLRQNTSQNMEMFTILLRLQASMPKAMTPGEVDKIRFEDVLGRTQYLPYEFFRHWEIVESMLRCKFRGCPGEQKVMDGEYVLMGSIFEDGKHVWMDIDKNAWEQTVFPDAHVRMSVEIKLLSANCNTINCPKCGCLNNTSRSTKSVLVQCPGCGLTFVPQRRLLGGLPALASHKAWSQAKIGPTALESYLARSCEALALQNPISGRSGTPENIATRIRNAEAIEMNAFRLVHINDASVAISKHDKWFHTSSATTELEDVHLAKYLRALLVDDATIAYNPVAYITAYGTLYQKSHKDDAKQMRKELHGPICEIVSDHVHDLATDVKKMLKASSDGNAHPEMARIMSEGVWENFKMRVSKIANLSKHVDEILIHGNSSFVYDFPLGFRTEYKKCNSLVPTVLQHAYLEMLSLAEDLGFRTLQCLIEETIFHSDSKNSLHMKGEELKELYETAYKHKI